MRAERGVQDGGDVAHPHGGVGADVPVAGDFGGFYSQPERVDDDDETEPRNRRQLAGEQGAGSLPCRCSAPALQRVEHQALVDRDELDRVVSVVSGEVPGRELGVQFALEARSQALGVRPVGLGADPGRSRVPVHDRIGRGSHYNPG